MVVPVCLSTSRMYPSSDLHAPGTSPARYLDLASFTLCTRVSPGPTPRESTNRSRKSCAHAAWVKVSTTDAVPKVEFVPVAPHPLSDNGEVRSEAQKSDPPPPPPAAPPSGPNPPPPPPPPAL